MTESGPPERRSRPVPPTAEREQALAGLRTRTQRTRPPRSRPTTRSTDSCRDRLPLLPRPCTLRYFGLPRPIHLTARRHFVPSCFRRWFGASSVDEQTQSRPRPLRHRRRRVGHESALRPTRPSVTSATQATVILFEGSGRGDGPTGWVVRRVRFDRPGSGSIVIALMCRVVRRI